MQSEPWMKYTPTSEQEVVVLFALLLPNLSMHLEIDEVREQFPDCLAWRIDEDGSRSFIRIEFELYSSNFKAHGHDPNGCDLIVCWEDDMPGFAVPRLQLRPIAESAAPAIISIPMRPKYEAVVWNEKTYLAACADDTRAAQSTLLEWARGMGIGEVVFGKGPKIASWTFQISLGSQKYCTLFGVHANNEIWPIWIPPLPKELADRYKEELQHAPKFKDAIEAGKAWCVVNQKEPEVIRVLQSAVQSVILLLGKETGLTMLTK
jgi:hypothetical protein